MTEFFNKFYNRPVPNLHLLPAYRQAGNRDLTPAAISAKNTLDPHG
jgi:hypothetical protein